MCEYINTAVPSRRNRMKKSTEVVEVFEWSWMLFFQYGSKTKVKGMRRR